MDCTNKTERLMEDVEVRRFFPDNLADIVGYPEEKIKYFGIHTTKRKENNGRGATLISESLYLAPVVDNLFLYNHREDLDLRQSTNRWIREEGFLYEEMAVGKYRDSLYGFSTVLVLRVQNWTQPIAEPIKFAELLRYADHERFRRRGLAAAVLDSVCNELAVSYGTRFVYVNYGWASWPKKSEVIPVCFSSQSVREGIMGCFPHRDYHHTFFENFNRAGFFKITEPQINAREHEAAMNKYNANAQRIDKNNTKTIN